MRWHTIALRFHIIADSYCTHIALVARAMEMWTNVQQDISLVATCPIFPALQNKNGTPPLWKISIIAPVRTGSCMHAKFQIYWLGFNILERSNKYYQHSATSNLNSKGWIFFVSVWNGPKLTKRLQRYFGWLWHLRIYVFTVWYINKVWLYSNNDQENTRNGGKQNKKQTNGNERCVCHACASLVHSLVLARTDHSLAAAVGPPPSLFCPTVVPDDTIASSVKPVAVQILATTSNNYLDHIFFHVAALSMPEQKHNKIVWWRINVTSMFCL